MSTSPLGTTAVIRSIGPKGLQSTQLVAADLIHRKPILVFTLRGQDENEEWYEIDFRFKIDPKKIRPDHNNRIQAIRDRLNAAQKTIEKMAAATGALGQRSAPGVKREDLPDADILTELYDELDRAMDERLLAVVMVQNGQTLWEYVDENNNHVNLTSELLRGDLHLAEAIHGAFQEWYVPTKAQSEASTKAKPVEDSTKDSTPATPKALSSGSATPSTAQENNEKTQPAKG